jgi:uncharacterized protein
MPFDFIQLALDESMRSYDRDGHLHVRVSHITKACVNGYRGGEIPGCDKLGLDPNRTYMLLRHPAELQKAAATFNNLKILDQHIPVTAYDESRERVIGSTGTDAAWNAPYLDNSLVFWSGHAIAMIESGAMRELSSAYRYTPIMTPGVYLGQRYDGVMTEIIGNHVALVEAGRAGSDVVVMDSKPKEMRMKTALSSSAAYMAGSAVAYLTPLLAQDKKLPDLKPLFAGVTRKNWAQKRATVEAAIVRAAKPVLASDAEVHIHEHLDGAGGDAPDDAAPPGGDPNGGNGGLAVGGAANEGTNPADNGNGGAGDDDLAAKVQQLLQGQIDDNDLAIILHALKSVKPPDAGNGNGNGNGNGGGADNDPNDDDKKPEGAADQDGVVDKPDTIRNGNTPAMDKNPVTKVAMDAAIQKAVGEAIAKTTDRLNARDLAKTFVRPWVGDIAVAMDSASEVFKFALEQMGEDVKDIHPSAYKALLSKIPKPGEQERQPRVPHHAMDADGNKDYLARFPNANRLTKH